MKNILKLAVAVALLCGCVACEPVEYENYGTIYGIVSDVETAETLPNAAVVLSPGGTSQMTGNDGRFEFTELEIRQYTITVQKDGYSTNRKTVNAVVGESVEANIPMSKRK
ncbi:MAG: carboxypeptidase-like regulatory domain-containing protein [Bacteroidales bacterium]|nr:carboxypeptidase-like regulatory domain-containing protein [Bacteroidales bacterium]